MYMYLQLLSTTTAKYKVIYPYICFFIDGVVAIEINHLRGPVHGSRVLLDLSQTTPKSGRKQTAVRKIEIQYKQSEKIPKRMSLNNIRYRAVQ